MISRLGKITEDFKTSFSFRFAPSLLGKKIESSHKILTALAKDDPSELQGVSPLERLWFISDAGDFVEDSLMSFALKSRAVLCVEKGMELGWDLSFGHTIWSSETLGQKLSWNNSIMHTLASVSDSQPLVFIGKTLIERGVPFDIPNNRKITPLHVAATYGQPSMIELLMQNKSDVDAADDCGMTPLMMALSSGRAQNAEKLIFWGARQDLRSSDGRGMDWFASLSGDEKTVKMAVNFGLMHPNDWVILKEEIKNNDVVFTNEKGISRWMSEKAKKA